MKSLKLISFVFIFFGILPFTRSVYSERNDSANYKVLSSTNKSFSISTVELNIIEGDNFIKKGDFEKAKESFKKARELSKKMAIFYLDINNSFKGIDARVPNEMRKKGLEILKIQAKTKQIGWKLDKRNKPNETRHETKNKQNLTQKKQANAKQQTKNTNNYGNATN